MTAPCLTGLGVDVYEIIDMGDYFCVDFDGTTLEELTAAITELQQHPDYPSKNDLWRLGGKVFQVQFTDLDRITDYIAQGYPGHATRTKTAIVTAPGMNAGIAELWAATTGRLPYKVEVFTDEERALHWLQDR